jgi:hypothetical protein
MCGCTTRTHARTHTCTYTWLVEADQQPHERVGDASIGLQHEETAVKYVVVARPHGANHVPLRAGVVGFQPLRAGPVAERREHEVVRSTRMYTSESR